MIAYKKERIDNFRLRKQFSGWNKAKFITGEEYQSLLKTFPTPYYQPNIFARTGLFIFGCIVVSAAFGLLLMFGGAKLMIEFFITACILIFAAEYFFREKNFFKSGITDALIYTGVLLMCLSLFMMLEGGMNEVTFDKDPLVYLFIALPIVTIAAIRYADAFLALVSYLLLLVINTLLVLKAGVFGKIILPFESMIFSFMIYFFTTRIRNRDQLAYWKNCFTMLETVSVLTLYASGNYLVVRQLGELLLDASYPSGSDIPLSYFFYAYTLLAPIVFIWQGLRKKDLILIRAGILAEAIGVLSIRYYYSILPAEFAMLIGGAVLMAIAGFTISYLRTPRHGITYRDETEYDREAIDALSALVVSRTASGMHSPENHERFGGGQSGAGGAGGQF